jgi:hypothetical protein
MKKMNPKDILVPALALLLICLVATTLLAGTNLLTKDKIAQIAVEAENQAKSAVIDANSFSDAKEIDIDSIKAKQSELQNRQKEIGNKQKTINARKSANETAVMGIKTKSADICKVEEKWLATAVNGAVFRDDLCIFSSVRNKLAGYYPEDLWRRKLAQEMHEFSQYAQSKYPRMMARGDLMTASMCVSKAIESALNIVYLLNREYAPYYKWKKKGALKFELGREIVPVLDKIAESPNQMYFWQNYRYSPAKINMKDKNVELLEEVAGIILKELQKQNLVIGSDLFLEGHISEILK